VVYLLSNGPLFRDFHAAGASVFAAPSRFFPLINSMLLRYVCRKNQFVFALVNSVESRPALMPLAKSGVPTISLIHEFASCYGRPQEIFADVAAWSDVLVFSSEITRKNALERCPALRDCHIHILPQGKSQIPVGALSEEQMEMENRRIFSLMRPHGRQDGSIVILGAGYVHIRKGVDLFIQCAARVIRMPGGDKCRFVWIGDGYHPEYDMTYSVYLADQVRRAGLADHFTFIDATPAIETAYAAADIFCLSSRLDPLPNVAIDALTHKLPVLCFDEATGIAEFLKSNGLQQQCVAHYLDVEDLANKIFQLASSPSLRYSVGERCEEVVNNCFDMGVYVITLEKIANQLIRQQDSNGSKMLMP